MKPTSRRLAVGAALTSALLTGCGVADVLDSDESGSDAPVAESSDPTAIEGALAVGETFDDGAVSTTVKAILRGEGAESWLPAGESFEWLSATVRTCVPAGGSTAEVGWYQWAATGADGGWYPAHLDYDRPKPDGQYPQLDDVAPGECAQGRVLIAVPREAEVVALINSDQAGVPQGTWLPGDVGAPAASDGE